MTDYTRAEKCAITRALNIIAEKASSSDEVFNSPTASGRFFKLYLADDMATREHFVVAFLNAQHQLIEAETLFSGTIDGAAVYPREVVRRALQLNAAAIVLSHNHPSGTAEPSSADRRITERIKDAVSLMDIRLLDHVIVTTGDTYSFAEHGLI